MKTLAQQDAEAFKPLFVEALRQEIEDLDQSLAQTRLNDLGVGHCQSLLDSFMVKVSQTEYDRVPAPSTIRNALKKMKQFDNATSTVQENVIELALFAQQLAYAQVTGDEQKVSELMAKKVASGVDVEKQEDNQQAIAASLTHLKEKVVEWLQDAQGSALADNEKAVVRKWAHGLEKVTQLAEPVSSSNINKLMSSQDNWPESLHSFQEQAGMTGRVLNNLNNTVFGFVKEMLEQEEQQEKTQLRGSSGGVLGSNAVQAPMPSM